MKINGSHPRIQDSDISEVEAVLGYPLPQQYRNFILQNNGGEPDPERFSTLDEKVESGVKYFFPIAGFGDDLLAEIDYFTIAGMIPRNLFPIATNPAEERILLSGTGDDMGNVYYWSWGEEPKNVTYLYRYMRKIADDFNGFLAKLHS